MDLNFYLAQITAILAWIFLIISYWKNKDNKLATKRRIFVNTPTSGLSLNSSTCLRWSNKETGVIIEEGDPSTIKTNFPLIIWMEATSGLSVYRTIG